MLLISAGCQNKQDQVMIIARVGDATYSMADLQASIPNDLEAEDSTELAQTLIQNWMNRELMFEKAKYNLLNEQSDIEQQVEKYRKELFIFAYEKELVNQKLDTAVSFQEIEAFYAENQDVFQLNDYILKVSYMKLKPNSPDLDKVKKWMVSKDKKDQALLQDYCYKYAVSCYNDSSWVYFNELLRELPIEVYNKEAFLRTGKFVSFSDADYLYLLLINAIQSKNTLSPIELETQHIKNLLLNKRKIELLNTIRRSLYKEAQRGGNAEIYEKPTLIR